MLDYRSILCQTKKLLFSPLSLLWILILTSSCAFFSSKKEEEKALPVVEWSSVTGKASWFKVHPRFSPKDAGVHPFFDLQPMVDYLEKSINFVVVTPAKGRVALGFDLVSGKFFKKFDFCEMDDAWGKGISVPTSPPYTEGMVPRVLDQLGDPLKILVFGREDFYQEFSGEVSHSARVVGGIMEQYCEFPPCEKGKGWESRLVLVGIDPHDSKLKDVKNIRDLKKEYDWEEVLAFMQNANGVGFWMEKPYPVFRMVGEVPPAEALRFATSFSQIFTGKELNQIRRSCFKLYDLLWKKIGLLKKEYFIREEKRKKEEANRIEEEKFLGSLANRNEKEVLEKLKETNTPKDQEDRLRKRYSHFHEKYGRNFQTCTNFVNPSNIHYDFHRHWFFAQVAAVYKVQQLGYVYDCWKNGWKKNRVNNEGKFFDDPWKSLKGCTGSQINRLFPSAIKYLGKIQEAGRKHFRYVEYDNRPGGTHQRVYSWVFDKGKEPYCKNEVKEGGNRSTRIRPSVFPPDVSFESLLIDSESERKGLLF